MPIRAGYGPSDPAPPGRDVLQVAVDDLIAVMQALGVERAPVVAPVDDIWIALALARQEAGRVAHVLGISTGFPITQPEHYRQLHPVGRFFRACARHAPQLLPFLIRLLRARMIRSGLGNHARSNMRSPADLAALDDPAIFDAWMAGFTYLYGPGRESEGALCAELRRYHHDWPRDLGDVACPVTLLHGRQDGNNPYDAARAMAELSRLAFSRRRGGGPACPLHLLGRRARPAVPHDRGSGADNKKNSRRSDPMQGRPSSDGCVSRPLC